MLVRIGLLLCRDCGRLLDLGIRALPSRSSASRAPSGGGAPHARPAALSPSLRGRGSGERRRHGSRPAAQRRRVAHDPALQGVRGACALGAGAGVGRAAAPSGLRQRRGAVQLHEGARAGRGLRHGAGRPRLAQARAHAAHAHRRHAARLRARRAPGGALRHRGRSVRPRPEQRAALGLGLPPLPRRVPALSSARRPLAGVGKS